ncbi:transmembrane protein, putative, partial (macronuclear) [Tetrahymena thermophila SB210]
DQLKQINLNIQLNSNLYTQHYSFRQNNGTFNLTNLISVYGQFNSEVELVFSSDIIQIPLYQNISDSLQISNYSSKYYAFLKIKIKNECNPGYELQKFQTILDYCSPCLEGYYNTQPNQHCIKCPDSAYYCKYQTILLKKGFWRENSTSSNILACNQNKNSCIESQAGVNLVNTNQQCAEGYIGPICDDCDIENQYWGQRYQKIGNNQCVSCQQDFKYSILMFTGIIFYSLIFCIYITDSTINQFKQQVVDEYFKILKIYVAKKSHISSTIIKILINYFQLISIIVNMNIPIPRSLGNFIVIFGSPSQLSQTNLDCLYVQIAKFFGLQFLYAKFLIGQIQLVIICLMFFGFYRIFCLYMKRRFHLYHLITGLVLIYYQNLSGIIQQLLGSISCRKIGQRSYVLDYPQYECNDEHLKSALYILFPFLFVWAIIIPLLLLYFLFKNQFNLNKLKQLTLLGFLYEGYEINQYYWEIIQIAKNILIAFFLKFYGDFNPLMYILCAITILVYSMLLQKFKPLSCQRLNNLNLTCSCYSILIIMLGLIAQEFQIYAVSILCLLLILILNICLAVQVIQIILKEYLTKIKLFFYPLILNLLDKLHIKVDRTLFNVITKQHVIDLWKKITFQVHKKNQKVSKSNNFFSQEFQQDLFFANLQDCLRYAQMQIILRKTKVLNQHQSQFNIKQSHTQANTCFQQNIDTLKQNKLAKQ